MGWVSLRVVLAYILPGFLPVSVVAYFCGYLIFGPNQTSSTLDIGSYLLLGVLAGLVIDAFRHRAHKALVRSRLAGFLTRLVLYPVSALTRGIITVSADWPYGAYTHYDEHEKELIRLWLKVKYHQNKQLARDAEKLGYKGYFDDLINTGTIGTSEIWAMLALLGHQKLRFFLEEHFSYYEFAMNIYCALWFTLIYGVIAALIRFSEFSLIWWLIWIAGHIVALGLVYDTAMFWLLVSKRFFRKLLEFELLNDNIETSAADSTE